MHEKIAALFGEQTKREPYLAALRSVEIDFIENPATLDACNGLMLTGGADVDPARYNQARHPETEPPDTERDQREASLLSDALKRDIPVLAICRGMQLLNVALGGTLAQHIEGHRQRGEPDAHSVHIREGTRLASILNNGEYRVNSRHHQSVANLGKDLVSTATAPDGIIEALELPGRHFVVAVQWHPEDRLETADRKLFQAFAEAVHTVSATARA
jgi:gamma-glutamyl-gamma-aminobutyrate hydrolase PuuD